VKTEQDNIALDKMHEHLLKEPNEQGNIAFGGADKVNYFLPPINDISALLSLPSNQKQFLDLFENEYNTLLDIKRSGRYSLEQKGVGTRTVSKLFNWLKKLPIPFTKLVSLEQWKHLGKSLRHHSNSGSWLIAIRGFDLSFKSASNGDNHELTPLFQFIHQRCADDMTFLKNLRKKVKNNEISETDKTDQWPHLRDVWDHYSKVPSQQFSHFGELFQYSDPSHLTKQQNLQAVESYYHLSLDFHLEMISHFELGCILYFDKNEQEHSSNMGLLGNSIHYFAINDDKKSCFGSLLTELKKHIEKITPAMSLRDFASFIELEPNKNNNDAEDETSINDRKYSLLKEWRSNKSTPSVKKLDKFLSNLSQHIGTEDFYPVSVYCRIAIGIDKTITDAIKKLASEGLSSKETETIIKKILSQLPSYYELNHRNYFKNKEQT